MSRLSIEVTPEFHHAIKAMAMERGVSLHDLVVERFADAKLYQPHSLEKLELEEFRSKIQNGVESGSSIPAEDVFARLEGKYKAMIVQ